MLVAAAKINRASLRPTYILQFYELKEFLTQFLGISIQRSPALNWMPLPGALSNLLQTTDLSTEMFD